VACVACGSWTSVDGNPWLEQENVGGTQNTCGPPHNFMSVRGALEYTCGIPRPGGFAGLGAHAWRNAAAQEEETKREFQSPALMRL